APEVWLLCERALGASDRTKYYLVHLPATASLRTLVRLTHQRWAIEQQYQELKDELGLDHFEGRSLPGGSSPPLPGWTSSTAPAGPNGYDVAGLGATSASIWTGTRPNCGS